MGSIISAPQKARANSGIAAAGANFGAVFPYMRAV